MPGLTGVRAAKETVLQGGFSVGQEVVVELGGGECQNGRIQKWIAAESEWQVVLCPGRRQLKVKPTCLRFQGESDESEKAIGEREFGKDRPCADTLSVGDVVQFKIGGVWEDAAVAELMDSALGSSRTVKIVSLADCTPKTVPLFSLRQKENCLLRSRRVKACGVARKKLLKDKITTADVTAVLRLWAFAPNSMRGNVIPEGKSFVFSDTLGLVTKRTNAKQCCESQLSREYPDLMRLMCRWLKDNAPEENDQEFPFTSINLNFAYNARLHRDNRNVGPSLLRAVGKFTGGKLNYYPDDDKSLNLEQLGNLPSKHHSSFDISKKFTLIDGNRAHGVDEFSGERFSVVFFSCGSYLSASKELVKSVVNCGATWPKPSSMAYFRRKLPTPRGYGLAMESKTPSSKSRGQKRKAELELAADHKLNTVGSMYKLIDYPHLNLQLDLGKVYSTASLVKRCHGNAEKLTALRRKLNDAAIFEPTDS